jgi:hypothetical protein
LRKYQDAANMSSSIPYSSIVLKQRVSGNRTLVMTKPENVMLIHPPIRVTRKAFVKFLFIVSVSIVGSVIEGSTVCFPYRFLKTLSSGFQSNIFLSRKTFGKEFSIFPEDTDRTQLSDTCIWDSAAGWIHRGGLCLGSD